MAGGTLAQTIHELFNDGTVAGLSDGQLLAQFAARDGDASRLAFAALVKRHGPMVLRVCRGVLRNVHDAEDAFQATFLILARKARGIRQPDSLASWLYGVAHNVAATARAAEVRRRTHEQKAGAARPQAALGPNGDELGPVIHAELGRLPERYRAAVVLCCVEGLTQQQAAQRLGVPLGTVQSRLARGREQLRGRLVRRGVALTAALTAATAHAAVPAALENTTVELVRRFGAARVLTTATVPVAIRTLVRRVINAMFLNTLKSASLAIALAALLIAGAAAYAFQSTPPAPADAPRPAAPPAAPATPGKLAITGTVVMPDGAPAAGAIVSFNPANHEPMGVARADDDGRFRLEGVFGNGAHLYARSADGGHQVLFDVPTVATRATLAAPVRLTLAPAVERSVTVVSGDSPVAGARVVALGLSFQAESLTGPDGRARLQLPRDSQLHRVAAWHPKQGVDGVESRGDHPLADPLRLTLRPTNPHVVRAVDTNGKPVGGVEFEITVRVEDAGWIVARHTAETHVRTNDEGVATVSWVPATKVQFVSPELVGSDWQIDDIDRDQTRAGITTVHVRRLHTVQGRLVMPEGASAEGILVSGSGFGPKHHGNRPDARARRDGTFALRIPAGYAFVLGIDDLQWAADSWAGTILARDDAEAARIEMKAYPATPLSVRVTRGPKHEPVANAWISLSTRGNVTWTDADGRTRQGNGGVDNWLFTDASGTARAGVSRGEHGLRLSAGDWVDEKSIKVSSAESVTVEFHRDWIGERKIRGRLTLQGAPYTPSRGLVARAWIPQLNTLPRPYNLEIAADGTFEVAFDAESMSLFFRDSEQHRAGFLTLGADSTTADVPMEATVTYGGTLVDENNQPLANRTLQLYIKNAWRQGSTAPQPTDANGRFRFVEVPVNVPLQLEMVDDREEPDYFVAAERLFIKGDARENDRVGARRMNRAKAVAPAPVPLGDRVADLCGNAGPAGMHVLFVLQGDNSGDTVSIRDRLLDDRRKHDVLGYLTAHLEAGEATTVAGRNWPKPVAGEIMLVALDGEQKVLATQRIATGDVAAAVERGDAFLKDHAPPAHDALRALNEARQDAQRTGRRVWVVVGGPRCGPCFRLARWMKEHHARLERDYVIVKVMEGIDASSADVVAKLPIKPGDGIPWHAITEPDGTILITSDGPLGNIGFPGSVEGIRHLRAMLERTASKLDAEDVRRLVDSLSKAP